LGVTGTRDLKVARDALAVGVQSLAMYGPRGLDGSVDFPLHEPQHVFAAQLFVAELFLETISQGHFTHLVTRLSNMRSKNTASF